MSLPGSDVERLTSRCLIYEESVEANVTCVVFRSWPLPPGYDRATADLLVRLPGGYPDLPPDMWWFDPAVKRADGSMVQNTEAIEHHLGRSWQRWSRHFNAGQWQSGIDGLESFLALIRRELERCAGGPR
jgi:Prokaryotic E2 family E